MELFNELQSSITKFSSKNAFYINEAYYSYHDFAKAISKIRAAIRTIDISEKNVAVVANNDIETYAAIIALWFEGRAYVPVSPDSPKERNESILDQAEISTVIDSSSKILFPNRTTVASLHLPDCEIELSPVPVLKEEIAYILFTSGTTGIPKGVPITRTNVSGFADSFFQLGYDITENDRFLQMFELTFDLSVMSYLIPLLRGACIYTIPSDKIKYNYIFELMDEHKLTFSLMVPSILHYLRPYFHEINCPLMRYSLFCGEALHEDITNEWGKCLPNAQIINVYGPTEDTIFCTHYQFERDKPNKTYNGMLSIGTSMINNLAVIVNDDNEILPANEKGQLCLAGIQLTPGYWRNEDKNKEAFFTASYRNEATRFYKTGDLAYADADGDIYYMGRLDYQTKIQGFRVELSEIEFYAKQFLGKVNAIAVAFNNQIDNTEIGLVIESIPHEMDKLLEYLRIKIPAYMIPTQIRFKNPFPLNVNGKVDRNSLKKLF